jgi:hypothetical protein
MGGLAVSSLQVNTLHDVADHSLPPTQATSVMALQPMGAFNRHAWSCGLQA